MTVTTAKWTLQDYHRMIEVGLLENRQTYAAAEIRDYWVVDLTSQQLRVFRDPVDGDYRTETILSSGTVSPLAFPDLGISAQHLLEE